MASRHRQDFFHAPGVTYLNCAYQGPMPRVAVEAAIQALELKKTPHLIRDELHFSYPDGFRRAIGRLIGSPIENIAVTDSTTHGVMLVVNGLDWREGDEVLLPEHEFPSNRFPWLSLEAQGVRVRTVAARPDADDAETFAAAFSDRTRVVSVGWINYSTGLRYDLEALSRLCRERDALLVVDGTQGIGGLAFDLRETPCDVLACSGYKWLLGPYGIGFAYLRPEVAERLTVRNISWLAIVGAEDFSRLSNCELELVDTARRFDKNETASFINVAAATAAAEYILEVTPEAIESHVTALLDRLIERLPEGFRPVSDLTPARRSNIFCFAHEAPQRTEAAFRRLEEAGIVASLREAAIRVSPNIYNTEEEIDRVAGLLA